MTEQLKTNALYVFATEVIHGAYKPEELKDAAMRAIRHHSAQPAQAVPASCGECGKKTSDGWALYCVACMEEAGLPAQAVPLLSDEEMEAAIRPFYRDSYSASMAMLNNISEYLAVEQAVRAKMGVAVPMTDAEILSAAKAIEARRIESARQAVLGRAGSKCSQCGGVMGVDSNGYNTFNRCESCLHVPMFMQDGSEFPPPPGIVGKEGGNG